jgi:hypothetical protein
MSNVSRLYSVSFPSLNPHSSHTVVHQTRANELFLSSLLYYLKWTIAEESCNAVYAETVQCNESYSLIIYVLVSGCTVKTSSQLVAMKINNTALARGLCRFVWRRLVELSASKKQSIGRRFMEPEGECRATSRNSSLLAHPRVPFIIYSVKHTYKWNWIMRIGVRWL